MLTQPHERHNLHLLYLVATATFPLALCTYWTVQERKTRPLPLLCADITSPACSTRSFQEPGLVHYG